MIVCAESTWEDFYVIIHEMGHLHYYMAFNKQPTIFQVNNFGMLNYLCWIDEQNLFENNLTGCKYRHAGEYW